MYSIVSPAQATKCRITRTSPRRRTPPPPLILGIRRRVTQNTAAYNTGESEKELNSVSCMVTAGEM